MRTEFDNMIRSIKEKYFFLNNGNRINDIINYIIKDNKHLKDNQKYKTIVKNKILNQINTIIIDEYNKDPIIFINNYIDKVFKNTDSYRQALINLKNLSTFLTENNLDYNEELVFDLIVTNTSLSESIQTFYKKNEERLSITPNFIENDFIKLCLKIYLNLNEEEDEDDSSFKNDKGYDNERKYMPDAFKLYIKDLGDPENLTKEEEREMYIKAKNGDKNAKDEFFRHYYKLVISIAKRYQYRGLPLLDLIEEGNLGLFTAFDKFDIEKDVKFSTYSTFWIRQAVTRGIYDKSRLIRIPCDNNILYERYRKGKVELANILNREPSISEMAKYLKVDESKLFTVLAADNTYSLNIKINKEDSDSEELSDFKPSDVDIESEFISKDLKDVLKKALSVANISERDKEIIDLRFGLTSGIPMRLRQVGEVFDLSRERVRQIEGKALNKLRTDKNILRLKNYIVEEDNQDENVNEFYNSLCDEEGNFDNKNTFKTIYELIVNMSKDKDQIDKAISKLDLNDSTIIKIIYGNDLSNPKYGRVTKKEIYIFFNEIRPRIIQMIVNENFDPYKHKNKKLILKNNSINKEKVGE